MIKWTGYIKSFLNLIMAWRIPLLIRIVMGKEGCYDLWLDKEDTLYCLQTIYLLDGKPEEVGESIGYTKSEITNKLVELSSYNQFAVREWDWK